MRLGVNGRFLAAPPGGVRRFAEEIARRVLAEAGGVLFLPGGTPEPVAGGASAAWHSSAAGRDGMTGGADADAPGGVDVLAGVDASAGFDVRRGRFRGHLWEQIELPRAARKAGCDVVLHLANAAPLLGGPHVATVHDVTPLTHPHWFRRRYALWHGWAVRTALRRAAALLTVSEWSAGEVRRVLDVPADRVRVAPQGAAPLDAPAPPEEVEAVRRRLGLDGPYLLAVGARDPRKNVAFLAGVLERLEARGCPQLLVLVGARRAGRVWADPPELFGGSAIRPVGEVDDGTLRALYTGAVALCHPALAEGFGRPPVEAMACETPVVAAPYGPARAVLGEAAEIVPLEAGAWAATLERLSAEPPELRARRIERGRRRAGVHRWADGVRCVLDVCGRVARLGGPVPRADGGRTA